MGNRFVDNETELNAATLNGLEDDMKRYAEEQRETAASETTIGGIRIWVSGSTLNISTEK